MTGIPVYNVNNNCATGSTALFVAYNLISGGLCDCALALGFEKMQRGSLSSMYSDRSNPVEKHVEVMTEVYELEAAPITPQMFGNAGREHMQKYGTKAEHFAKVAYKNHKHSVNNPRSQFKKEYSMDEILNAPTIHAPLTKLQCCPTSDGGAAAILVSEAFVRAHRLESKAVEIVGMEMATDLASTFEEKSMMKIVGYDMTKKAADTLFAKTGFQASDCQVVELHDCFSANELITYEALGLCPEGGAGKFIDAGDNTYGGRFVVNPSGGLISKGHPLGATGLAQCAELTWQLRGDAGQRQVPDCRMALQHNLGLGGCCVVSLYRKGFNARNQAQKLQLTANPVAAEDFKCTFIFDEIEKGMKTTEGGDIVKKVKGIFCFKVNGGPGGKQGIWFVDCKNGNGAVMRGGDVKADCTITIGDEDLVKLMLGKLNPQQAFFQGKLKIAGNMGLAMKLREFQSRLKNLQAKL